MGSHTTTVTRTCSVVLDERENFEMKTKGSSFIFAEMRLDIDMFYLCYQAKLCRSKVTKFFEK